MVVQAAITKGPYLINPGRTSMMIMWESDSAGEAVLRYGLHTDMELSLTLRPFDEKNDLFLYQAALNQLKPGLKYYYQIQQSEVKTKISRFYCAPPPDAAIELVAIGDSRTGHETHRKISDLILDIDPDLVISMGDLVGTGGNFDEWGPHFFEPAAKVIDHIPLISTVGDHDTQADDGQNFQYYLRPANSPAHFWFSFDYGPAHFVSLDYRGEKDPEMMDWFKKDMTASDARWKIVYLHRPSYNLGGHRTNWGADHWPALYRKYKVDIVFAGHSHMYERFYPMRPEHEPAAWPVTYITTGGAGAELYDAVEHDFLAVTRSINHLMHLAINKDTLTAVTLLQDGSRIDRFQMIKKDDRYDPAYLKLVKFQELMDAYMAFASKLQLRFEQIPTISEPATKELTFESNTISGEIEFEVKLAAGSAEHYKLEPLKGVLKKGQPFNGTIRVYAKHPLNIKGRYFDPPLFFNAHYKASGLNGVAIGRESRYYPPEK
jgi:predicted phosphodiesterase